MCLPSPFGWPRFGWPSRCKPHRLVRVLAWNELVVLVALHSALSGCRKPQVDESTARATVPSSVTIHSAQMSNANDRPRAKLPTTGIEIIDVPNDRPILVVVGADSGRPIVYLHGMCSESRSDLQAWNSSVRSFGTILALRGDATCADPTGGSTWTSNIDAIDRRIDAAVAAVQARGVNLDGSGVILIGESLGATRAEALATTFPSKYERLVLVGAPQIPSAKNLERARAVALLAGEKEPKQNMLAGTSALRAQGLSARFWELPEATHGTYGPQGDRIMGEAVGFVSGPRND